MRGDVVIGETGVKLRGDTVLGLNEAVARGYMGVEVGEVMGLRGEGVGLREAVARG